MPLLQLFTAMLVLLLQLLNKMIVIVMISVFMIVLCGLLLIPVFFAFAVLVVFLNLSSGG